MCLLPWCSTRARTVFTSSDLISSLWVTNNRINAGDDSVAFNADDGNRPGSGDPNYTYATAVCGAREVGTDHRCT